MKNPDNNIFVARRRLMKEAARHPAYKIRYNRKTGKLEPKVSFYRLLADKRRGKAGHGIAV